jgi:hypothetical protein
MWLVVSVLGERAHPGKSWKKDRDRLLPGGCGWVAGLWVCVTGRGAVDRRSLLPPHFPSQIK